MRDASVVLGPGPARAHVNAGRHVQTGQTCYGRARRRNRPARAKENAGPDPWTGKMLTSTAVLGTGPAAITPSAGPGVRNGARCGTSDRQPAV